MYIRVKVVGGLEPPYIPQLPILGLIPTQLYLDCAGNFLLVTGKSSLLCTFRHMVRAIHSACVVNVLYSAGVTNL